MPIRLFPKLFPQREEESEVLWAVLRQQNPAQPPADTLKMVRALLEGKASSKEVTTVVDQALPKLAGLRPDEADRWSRALAEAALACKQETPALAALAKAGTAGALQRLGDALAAKKDWKGAAERYRQAWRAWEKQPGPRDLPHPLPLYLAGHALEKAGQKEEGKKRMEQAHWVLLGDEVARLELARELARRGHDEAAAREYRLIAQVGHPGSFYAGEALRRVAADALARKDYLKAALGHEQAMLRCLQPYIDFVNPSAYLGVPAYVHRLRAAGHFKAGKVEEALREVALAQALLPAGVEVPILAVPELERLGRKKEAAEVFDRAAALYEKLCRDYPNCAWAHNSAAWLSACCRRNLAKALSHAEQAVKLAPDTAGHLDTLAEVHFQLGHKDKAVELQKKVIQMEPNKPYFRLQLKRLEAGDPSAERPPEGDD
jgi:tetratricopeptide (TPR) repeat protein